MKLHLSSTAGLNIFTAYGEGYVAVNHRKYEENLIVLPDSVTPDWSTATVATPQSKNLRSPMTPTTATMSKLFGTI
mgnify:CR=1 FL=1